MAKKNKTFLSKYIKKFKKLDKKIKISIFAGIGILLSLILIISIVNIVKKNKIPSSNEMFKKFIEQYAAASEYEESALITTNNNIKLEFTSIVAEDFDTVHMNIYSSDNIKELYVDTLDRKYQVYIYDGSKWVGHIASKYTAIDDDRTDYIEKDGLTTSEVVKREDIHNERVIKNSDNTYDLIFEAKYNKIEGLLGETIFAIYNSFEYNKLKPFFSLYKEDIKVKVTAHFGNNKKLLNWKIESNEELAKTANESYGIFNLTDFKIQFDNLKYDTLDVYVPIQVDVEAFKSKE